MKALKLEADEMWDGLVGMARQEEPVVLKGLVGEDLKKMTDLYESHSRQVIREEPEPRPDKPLLKLSEKQIKFEQARKNL